MTNCQRRLPPDSATSPTGWCCLRSRIATMTTPCGRASPNCSVVDDPLRAPQHRGVDHQAVELEHSALVGGCGKHGPRPLDLIGGRRVAGADDGHLRRMDRYLGVETDGHRVVDLLTETVEILDVEIHRIQRQPAECLGG